MPATRTELAAAARHLRRVDPILKPIIEQVGPCRLMRRRDRFDSLVTSIIAQQISSSAAKSIRRRIDELLAPHAVTAESLLAAGPDRLRGAGVSPQKLSYLLDLCAHVGDGRIRLRTIGRKSDEAVIEELIRVKGIGRWTAQMFLIFALGRMDVLPHDDLGIRMAIRDLYGLADLPDKETCHEIAQPWRPYASVASWYCWRSGDLDLRKRTKK